MTLYREVEQGRLFCNRQGNETATDIVRRDFCRLSLEPGAIAVSAAKQAKTSRRRNGGRQIRARSWRHGCKDDRMVDTKELCQSRVDRHSHLYGCGIVLPLPLRGGLAALWRI